MNNTILIWKLDKLPHPWFMISSVDLYEYSNLNKKNKKDPLAAAKLSKQIKCSDEILWFDMGGPRMILL